MEVFFQTAILCSRYWHSCIDGLQKVLVKHLFPGRFVVALEHILKLPKSVCPVKVAFFCSLVELRDGFINGKFDTIFTIILMDLDSTFVTRVVAIKFVDFRQVGVVVVPGLYDLI